MYDMREVLLRRPVLLPFSEFVRPSDLNNAAGSRRPFSPYAKKPNELCELQIVEQLYELFINQFSKPRRSKSANSKLRSRSEIILLTEGCVGFKAIAAVVTLPVSITARNAYWSR